MDYISYSAEETELYGASFGRQLPVNSVVCFFGNLGAGKTTFIKGVISGVLPKIAIDVSSPTFTYLNIYRDSGVSLYHFDLYRLRDGDEFLSMGFDEMFYAGGICCIEWSERIASLLPPDVICVTMIHRNETSRIIRITP